MVHIAYCPVRRDETGSQGFAGPNNTVAKALRHLRQAHECWASRHTGWKYRKTAGPQLIDHHEQDIFRLSHRASLRFVGGLMCANVCMRFSRGIHAEKRWSRPRTANTNYWKCCADMGVRRAMPKSLMAHWRFRRNRPAACRRSWNVTAGSSDVRWNATGRAVSGFALSASRSVRCAAALQLLIADEVLDGMCLFGMSVRRCFRRRGASPAPSPDRGHDPIRAAEVLANHNDNRVFLTGGELGERNVAPMD